MWYFRWFRTISRAPNSICPQVFWKFLLGHFKFGFFDFCSSHWLHFWFHKILSISFFRFFSDDQFGALFGARSYFEFWTIWKILWKSTWINLRSSRLLNSNWGPKWGPKLIIIEIYENRETQNRMVLKMKSIWWIEVKKATFEVL